jgi:hypothetical protein
MYRALINFASKDFTGMKGKIVEIKDKELASSLLENGYIEEVSSNDKEGLEKEITELKSVISNLNEENEKLIKELEEIKFSLEASNQNENTGNPASEEDKKIKDNINSEEESEKELEQNKNLNDKKK